MNEEAIDTFAEKARKRDPEGLAELYEHYYPRIFRFLYYRAGEDVAEDLTGEVFLRVVRNVHKQKGSMAAWIYRIARNVLIDFARSRKVKSKFEEAMNGTPEEGLSDARDAARGIDGRIDLRRAISRLTDEQREFITLKFVQGLSNSEIEQVTGRKQDAIRALQYRALSALRAILNPGVSS